MQFKEVLLKSKICVRFMELENMTEDDMYDLYINCFHSYMETFAERLRHGSFLRKTISAYRHIPGFVSTPPDTVVKIMIRSNKMHLWFAHRLWEEANRQIIERNTNAGEIWFRLSFTGTIPKAEIMEEIFSDHVKGAWIHIDANYKVLPARSSKLEAQS